MGTKQQLDTLQKLIENESSEAREVVVRQREAINAGNAKMIDITNLELEIHLQNIKKHVAKFDLIKEAAEIEFLSQFHG